jgi:hypothetical protein
MQVGRVGTIVIESNANAVMAEPVVFRADNIDRFAPLY